MDAALNNPKSTIYEYTRDKELEIVMRYAKRHKETDHWWHYLRLRCELKKLERGPNDTDLDQAFNKIMAAYEILRSEVKNRKIYASYTWRKVKRVGVKPVLEAWALSKQKQAGFKFLIKNGKYDLTGEYLILQFTNDFSPEVVAAAYRSLVDAGVPKRSLAFQAVDFDQWQGSLQGK